MCNAHSHTRQKVVASNLIEIRAGESNSRCQENKRTRRKKDEDGANGTKDKDGEANRTKKKD